MKQLSIKKQDSVVQKKAEKTLLEHIECIVELVENSNLNEEFYKKAKKNISYVSKKMGLTPKYGVLWINIYRFGGMWDEVLYLEVRI